MHYEAYTAREDAEGRDIPKSGAGRRLRAITSLSQAIPRAKLVTSTSEAARSLANRGDR